MGNVNPDINLNPESEYEMKEFMITARGTSVSDHDLTNYVLDLLWEIYENADDDGRVILSEDERHNIKEVLKMVGILDDRCVDCGGKGEWLHPERRVMIKCKACGGHGKLKFKRDAIAQVR